MSDGLAATRSGTGARRLEPAFVVTLALALRQVGRYRAPELLILLCAIAGSWLAT